jgi:sterol desaturase/sphingolipid hydroxylase (fatty acid hydroxylase superfamily)
MWRESFYCSTYVHLVLTVLIFIGAYLLMDFVPLTSDQSTIIDFDKLYSYADWLIKYIGMPFIILECIWSFLRRDKHHLGGDTFSNLIVGSVRSRIEPLLILTFYIKAYQFGNQVFNLHIDYTSWVNWLIIILLIDLCYYWDHRVSHKIGFLWANHSIHHSSEKFNFMTASRGSWIEGIYRWVFRFPVSLLGFPPMMIICVFRFMRFYQIFHHTDRVLGDWKGPAALFVGPEFHRIHHGVEKKYHDANYGGLFTIWDHLFFTYQARKASEKITYGVTNPEFNPNNPFSVALMPIWNYLKGLKIVRSKNSDRNISKARAT